MTYSFHPEACVEFKEATLYYSEKSRSLGAAFYSEVEYAIERIVENPLLYRVIDERCSTLPHQMLSLCHSLLHRGLLHSDTGRHALQQGAIVLET